MVGPPAKPGEKPTQRPPVSGCQGGRYRHRSQQALQEQAAGAGVNVCLGLYWKAEKPYAQKHPWYANAYPASRKSPAHMFHLNLEL
jgi:hypothetical protein